MLQLDLDWSSDPVTHTAQTLLTGSPHAQQAPVIVGDNDMLSSDKPIHRDTIQ